MTRTFNRIGTAAQPDTMTTTKPATPLPFGLDPDSQIWLGNLCTNARTVAGWRDKADAYPELVAALRTTQEHLEARSEDTGLDVIRQKNRALLARLEGDK